MPPIQHQKYSVALGPEINAAESSLVDDLERVFSLFDTFSLINIPEVSLCGPTTCKRIRRTAVLPVSNGLCWFIVLAPILKRDHFSKGIPSRSPVHLGVRNIF